MHSTNNEQQEKDVQKTGYGTDDRSVLKVTNSRSAANEVCQLVAAWPGLARSLNLLQKSASGAGQEKVA